MSTRSKEIQAISELLYQRGLGMAGWRLLSANREASNGRPYKPLMKLIASEIKEQAPDLADRIGNLARSLEWADEPERSNGSEALGSPFGRIYE